MLFDNEAVQFDAKGEDGGGVRGEESLTPKSLIGKPSPADYGFMRMASDRNDFMDDFENMLAEGPSTRAA